ncbi:Hypothetical protein TPAS_1162 [Trichococcus pasteurii]|uniref:Uncharacterized protein n=1 Tax=Trichococcus pasteurii TaxID=43064 RepID=A0A1W1IEP8_9LACT|nr:hypothetical protein SAMN04488086_101355 [Trichococcus pasteurii]SLM51486.1 Hypothetical protein TPAS_1162 [Trichococcus pasteurii]SSB92367.1 Hypothetical protein TPAS_1162 [Trichococcus pasteurii]
MFFNCPHNLLVCFKKISQANPTLYALKKRLTLVRYWPFDQGSVVSSSDVILACQGGNNNLMAHKIYQFFVKGPARLNRLSSIWFRESRFR